jgi:HSP20 family protein
MMRGFMNHPFFQNMRDQAERQRDGDATDDADAFSPPVDIFNTEASFVVHVALPGANKEDVGVNWNPDSNTLSITGVVHRPGDEAFIQSLVSGERKVGMFERNVTLPPAGVAEKDSVDGFGITAKMENGVLVVVVPKAEREWTEIRKVDVQ